MAEIAPIQIRSLAHTVVRVHQITREWIAPRRLALVKVAHVGTGEYARTYQAEIIYHRHLGARALEITQARAAKL